MPLIFLRDSTERLNGFNQTALQYWNYTTWSNNTLSNGSECWLVFEKYKPVILSNGTFLNATSCYDPYYKIQYRGILGILYACLFAISVLFISINLRKHGRRFLPSQKRFRPIGRRWQWYWMLFVAACGTISGIVGIDVDRDYLQSLSIVLQNFFYHLMLPGILAACWESVRHWGSWQERQIVDRDPFSIRQDDRRGRIELYLPLIFYLFNFMNFFMTVPRAWGQIELQTTLSQQADVAGSQATDGRFKAGAFFALAAWVIILYSLRHSVHYYKHRSRGIWNSFNGALHWTPTKFFLVLPLCLVRIAYAIATAFIFDISPLKYDIRTRGQAYNDSISKWMYTLGFTPPLLIIAIFIIYGYLEENEDRVLIQQRVEHGRATDAELNIQPRKPRWWTRGRENLHMTPEQRLKSLTAEVGGGQPTLRGITSNIEMGNMSIRPRNESPSRPAGAPS
ncbi:MAG: hypothetical protein M1829_001119 [Trizodia sp. TS-e1964]|nr:MAG: hypothetical protein M1829_001119 [Trizodia sp. TS-e1964]